MLETIREYAGEKFSTVADRESVRERHYGLFLALAKRHGNDRAIFGPDRNEHLQRLDSELENLNAAVAWAIEQDAGAPALELTAALAEYWTTRNRFADALAFIEQALRQPGAERAPELRIRALCRKSGVMWPLGRKAEQAGIMAEAEALARTLADPAVLSRVLSDSAAHEIYSHRLDVASAHADEALSLANESGDPWTLAFAARARALASPTPPDLRERVDRAASLLQAVDNAYFHADVFHMAVFRALCNGSDEDASHFASRAIPLTRKLNDPFVWMLLRRKVGLAALFTGDTEAARDAFREQLELCQDLVVLPAAYEGLGGLAAVAVVRDDLDRAARLCGAAAAHRYGDPENAIDTRLDAAFFEPARTRRAPEAWDAAVRDGSALNFNDAIAYALTDSRTDAPDSAAKQPNTD
jgi:tetratricopeptide (TPR) repeat protein